MLEVNKQRRASGEQTIDVVKPERPAELERSFIKKVREDFKKKFLVLKQKMRQINDRNGLNSLESNTQIHEPEWAKQGRRLLVQNFDEDIVTGRRRLVGLS